MERFKELVLFVAYETRDDPRFGRTKLAKALFYTDFDAYGDERRSVTGATYRHYDEGPLPVDHIYDAERQLADEGWVRIKQPAFKGDEAKLIPLRERAPEPRGFESWQLETLRIHIRQISEQTAGQVSDESHEHPGWEFTRDKKPIPYYMEFAPRDKPSAATMELVRRLAREDQWP